jgi:phosphate-selective porin OprO/OprP
MAPAIAPAAAPLMMRAALLMIASAILFGFMAITIRYAAHQLHAFEIAFFRNAFGLLAEYIVSNQELSIGGVREDISNKAWQATASYVLTGEDTGYRGVVKPSRPFNPGTDGWGAFEVVGRYGALEIDDDVFPLFADPSVAASKATSWTLGLNWYLNSNLKLVLNYLQTSLEGGAAAGADREDEKAVFTRLQVAF